MGYVSFMLVSGSVYQTTQPGTPKWDLVVEQSAIGVEKVEKLMKMPRWHAWFWWIQRYAIHILVLERKHIGTCGWCPDTRIPVYMELLVGPYSNSYRDCNSKEDHPNTYGSLGILKGSSLFLCFRWRDRCWHGVVEDCERQRGFKRDQRHKAQRVSRKDGRSRIHFSKMMGKNWFWIWKYTWMQETCIENISLLKYYASFSIEYQDDFQIQGWRCSDTFLPFKIQGWNSWQIRGNHPMKKHSFTTSQPMGTFDELTRSDNFNLKVMTTSAQPLVIWAMKKHLVGWLVGWCIFSLPETNSSSLHPEKNNKPS